MQLLVEFERNADDDQESGCRERAVQTDCTESVDFKDIDRDQCDDTEVQRAEERYTVVDLPQIIAGGLSCSDTGNKSAVLLDHSRYVVRIELDLRIEVCEEDDEQEHERSVQMSAYAHPSVPPSHEAAGRIRISELHDHLGEHDQGRSEDDRHNAAAVDLDRNVRGLSAVHLVSFDLFRILYGDTSFAVVNENDQTEQYDDQRDESEQEPNAGIRTVFRLFRNGVDHSVPHISAERCEDTHEDQEGRSVSDSVFGDSFTEPHNEGAATRQNDDDEDHREDLACLARSENARNAFSPADHDTDRLYDREQYGQVSGILVDFLSSVFSVFAQSFKFGDNQRQKLHNDGGVDERNDTECKQRAVLQRTARYGV